MDITEYDTWVAEMRGAPRGEQRWTGRVRVYKSIRANPSLLTASVADFCASTGWSQSTLYSYFGRGPRKTRWDAFGESTDVVIPALAEAKAWAMRPFLRGAINEAEALQASSASKTEAVMRAAAEWAATDSVLAVELVDSTLDFLAKTLEGCSNAPAPDSPAPSWDEIARELVTYAAAHSDEPSVAALNAVRLKFPGELQLPEALSMADSVVDSLALYIEQVLEGTATDREIHDVVSVLEQALTTLGSHR